MKLPVFLFILILLSFSVLAVPPVTTLTSDTGLVIEVPQITNLKINEGYTFHFHVFNKTDGSFRFNDTVRCYFHLYNSTGNHLNTQNLTTISDTFDFSAAVGAGNFSQRGQYSYIIQCNDTTTGIGGFTSVPFEVTESRLPYYNIDNSGLVLALFFFMIIIPALLFYISFKFQLSRSALVHLLFKRCCWLLALFFMFFTSGLLFIMITEMMPIVKEQIIFFLWFYGWAGLVVLVFIIWKTVLDALSLWQGKKAKERYGDDDEE